MRGDTTPMMLSEYSPISKSTRPSLSLADSYKLHIHVVEVVIETAVDLVARLKISLGRTHPIGAHE
jgi:hypothetical protein